MKNTTNDTQIYDSMNGEFWGTLVEDPTNDEVLWAVDGGGSWEVIRLPSGRYFLHTAPECCTFIKPGDEYPDGIAPPEDMPVSEHEEQEICNAKSERLNMSADKSGAEVLREALEADLLKTIKLDPKLEAIVSATSTAT